MVNSTTAPPVTAPSFDPLNQVLPIDKTIKEIMSLEERPWEDSHHRVSISDLDMMPLQILSPNIPEIVSLPYTTIHTLDSEGNEGNISKTLVIDISIMIGIMENTQIGANHNPKEIVSFTYPFRDFCDVFPWFYEEMHDIDPPIFIHKIKKCRECFLQYFSCSLILNNIESPSLGSLNYHEDDQAFFLW